MQVWQRKCPLCFAKLEKETLEEPWRCACGWTTDIAKKREVYRGDRQGGDT
jgi:hypothetical protein